MNIARCTACETQWDASLSPLCSRCEHLRLLAAPGLISDKHDPRQLPFADHSYRSCLSQEVVDNVDAFVEYATACGSWYYHTGYDSWSHFTPEPLGRMPGSGIHAGDRIPDHELDGLMFADVLTDPHAYAVDQVQVRRQVRNGELIPLWRCSEDCNNLSIPGEADCVLHVVPPRAHGVE